MITIGNMFDFKTQSDYYEFVHGNSLPYAISFFYLGSPSFQSSTSFLLFTQCRQLTNNKIINKCFFFFLLTRQDPEDAPRTIAAWFQLCKSPSSLEPIFHYTQYSGSHTCWLSPGLCFVSAPPSLPPSLSLFFCSCLGVVCITVNVAACWFVD
jgi:hypothetical protein